MLCLELFRTRSWLGGGGGGEGGGGGGGEGRGSLEIQDALWVR